MRRNSAASPSLRRCLMSHPPTPPRHLPATALVLLSFAATPALAQETAQSAASGATKPAASATAAGASAGNGGAKGATADGTAAKGTKAEGVAATAAADNKALVIPQIDVSGCRPVGGGALSHARRGLDRRAGRNRHLHGPQPRRRAAHHARHLHPGEHAEPGIAVNIRGFEGSGRVNMMIDGVRQNFRFTSHDAQGFTYVDPALLAGVDVQRGAVSTAGGAGALAGTANFRTLGIDDIIQAGKTWGAIGNLSWGTNGTGWSEMVGLGANLGPNAAIAGAVSHNDTNNYQNGDGVSQPYTAQDLTSACSRPASTRPRTLVSPSAACSTTTPSAPIPTTRPSIRRRIRRTSPTRPTTR